MKPVSNISDSVSDKLLALHSRNTARAAIPLMLSILLTWFLLHNEVESVQVQVWALFSCTMILIRVALLQIIDRSDSLTPLQKRLSAIALTLILGCSIASVLMFFNTVQFFERTMLTAILLGICTAAISTNIGYPPLLLVFLAPILGGSSVMWAINTGREINPVFAFAVSASIIILAHTLLRNGRFMFEVFVLAIESSTKLEVQSKRLSEALQHAKEAKQAAETSSQSKTRFIAAASHDLRQPVHVLNLFSGALRNASLDDRTRDIVDSMGVAVTSLSSQLNSLLDISELDSGSVKPNYKSIDLSHLAHTLMREMQKLAEDKQIELVNEVPSSMHVWTDPAMLSQIVRNLCGNAIKYTEEGSVRIQARRDNSGIALSIVDTGIGIDDCDSGKVFEEFYQVSNHTRDKGKGLGLGLSIVERLIKTLGHELTLYSCVGEGTTVNISMQACEQVENDADARPVSALAHPAHALPDGFWVHLVDDETAVCTSVEAFLRTVGAKVTSSTSSASAIEFLSQHQPDALLIDLQLQDGDSGLAVLESVSNRDLPVALITGESISDTDIGNDYPDLVMLQKPVSDEALLELLDYMVVEREEQMDAV